jgi:GH35 family endo-1,4-beta-xylanase
LIEYVRDVLAAGVRFEVIGLQMYYPGRDLFEIDRHIELFCRLGKPVHITELGVPSSETPRQRKEDIHCPIARWHGRPWSETEQADWVEGYYTICYAKPEIEAITWWDFKETAWYPHGGLVHEDLRPKESYLRLERLLRGWGLRGGG